MPKFFLLLIAQDRRINFENRRCNFPMMRYRQSGAFCAPCQRADPAQAKRRSGNVGELLRKAIEGADLINRLDALSSKSNRKARRNGSAPIRRVARLEREMQTYLRRKEKQITSVRNYAPERYMRRNSLHARAARKPKIDERLCAAWRRVINPGLKVCPKAIQILVKTTYRLKAIRAAVGAKWIAEFFKKNLLPDLP